MSSTDPKSNSDFNTLIDAKSFREMDPGHTCVSVGDSPDSVTAGDKATLQIKYIADFDKPYNETFYACADIKFVETAKFDVEMPCFNATEPDSEDGAGPDWNFHDHDDDDASSSPSSTSSPDASKGGSKSGGGGSGISGGAIAGIVVGCVAGVSLVALGLLIYRRKSQHLQEIRKQNSSRGVAWEEQVGKGSVSSASTRMQNMSA